MFAYKKESPWSDSFHVASSHWLKQGFLIQKNFEKLNWEIGKFAMYFNSVPPKAGPNPTFKITSCRQQ